MRTITATELRQKLGEILDAASAGEKILIERDHRPLAYLVSVEDVRALETQDEEIERELAALDALIAIGEEWRQAHPQQPGEMTAEETIRWDRDHRDEEKWERSFGSDPEDATRTDEPKPTSQADDSESEL
jgi:prevent-host-death family protein